jgi:hypothetical protein
VTTAAMRSGGTPHSDSHAATALDWCSVMVTASDRTGQMAHLQGRSFGHTCADRTITAGDRHRQARERGHANSQMRRCFQMARHSCASVRPSLRSHFTRSCGSTMGRPLPCYPHGHGCGEGLPALERRSAPNTPLLAVRLPAPQPTRLHLGQPVVEGQGVAHEQRSQAVHAKAQPRQVVQDGEAAVREVLRVTAG